MYRGGTSSTPPKYYGVLLITVVTYYIASKYVFDKVYETLHIVVDELFHLPLGIQYCERNFTYWDPKITTPPGLYLISSAVSLYFECNTYNLRFVNLLASVVNLFLFSSILQYIYGGNTYLKTVLQALNLALLPPLYFFSHVYYTDTLSLTFLLAFSRLCFVNKHRIFILLFGFCSVLMRQTNIVWIAMVFGHKALDIMLRSSRVFGNNYLTNTSLSSKSMIAKDVDKSNTKRYYGLNDVFIALRYHISTCFTTFFKFLTLQDSLLLITHSVLLISFVIFVYVNGSIVVGDKTAHEATIHLPQLFYFLVFYGVFGLPYVLVSIKPTMKLIFDNKIKVVLFAIIFTAIVHYNTIEHPYLLSDNRHYIFYVWNRWYGKYELAKYVSVPAYIYLLFSLYANLKDQNCISFLLPYSICLTVVLCLQRLIEIRYFLIPYIILRLRFIRPPLKLVLTEFLWYVILNVVTLSIFYNKEVNWSDFDYVQRIVW